MKVNTLEQSFAQLMSAWHLLIVEQNISYSIGLSQYLHIAMHYK